MRAIAVSLENLSSPEHHDRRLDFRAMTYYETEEMIHLRPSQGENQPHTDGAMVGRPPSRKAPPFGQKLAALRKERGLTQQQLADFLGISIKRVDYYERRANDPSVGFVRQVASAFDVPLMSLIVDDEEVPRKKRTKHGPPSALEERIERLRQLPKGQQEVVIKMLDGLLSSASA